MAPFITKTEFKLPNLAFSILEPSPSNPYDPITLTSPPDVTFHKRNTNLSAIASKSPSRCIRHHPPFSISLPKKAIVSTVCWRRSIRRTTLVLSLVVFWASTNRKCGVRRMEVGRRMGKGNWRVEIVPLGEITRMALLLVSVTKRVSFSEVKQEQLCESKRLRNPE